MRRIIGWLGVVLSMAGVAGAQPPESDVYLLTLEGEGDEKPVFGEPRNVTDRAGYDNQPSFLPDGSALVYTSIRDGQADIYRFDLASGRTEPVFETPESEYSPTPIDGGRALSMVRVDGEGRQLLWSYSLVDESWEEISLGVEPIGYHAWGVDGELLLFVLGEPPTLRWWKPGGEISVLAENPGRSLHRIPGGSLFSFVQKDGSGGTVIRSFDPSTGALEEVIATRAGDEDLAWDPRGRAWMADGSRLYRYCSECGGGWRRMVDLGQWGIGGVSRLAFSPDGRTLAFVADRDP